jgi:hypothetical protein
MSLSDLASLGSFVSGVAVLISLIYLSIQVRQAEKIQRSSMQQARADRASNGALKVAEDGISSIYAKGLAGDERLTNEDIQRFLSVARAILVSAEDSFLHHKSGQIDDGTWRGVQAALRGWGRSPGFRAAWRMTSDRYTAEFAAFVDTALKETPVAKDSDLTATWIELVRKEKAGN